MKAVSYLKCGDHAQDFLIPYIAQTETLLRRALRKLDSTADCRITGAADLCIPHDVIRLAGGFATGCLVEWSCKVPVIPVDTTVNIDTSSIFYIDGDISDQFTSERFADLIEVTTSGSSYVWNFNKGNHFISLCRRRSDGGLALIFHSNEKEFKYQTNGLIPVLGNWFWDDIETFNEGDRYMRLLVGANATHFAAVAKMLEEFNIQRHRFFALQLCRKFASIESEQHDHHYFMPSSTSVAMGVYVCSPNDVVPVFSKPGGAIPMFQATAGGLNSNGEKLLVPHGWGKTSKCPLSIHISDGRLVVNGKPFNIAPRESLGDHPDLSLREFTNDPLSEGSFFDEISQSCPGKVVDVFDQLISYSKIGVCDHRRRKK